MAFDPAAPWHRASYDRFLNEGLPQLLAARLPLAGYRVEEGEPHRCGVRLALTGSDGDLEVVYEDLPRPDEEGCFQVDGQPVVVLPVTAETDLAAASIACVGEQALEL